MPRILTINRHHIYIMTMRTIGFDWSIVCALKDETLPWEDSEPDPRSEILVWDEALEARIHRGEFQLIICHTLKDLVHLARFRSTPLLFVAHIALYQQRPSLWFKSLFKRELLRGLMLFRGVKCVAISPWKQRTWQLPMRVIPTPPLPTFPVLWPPGQIPEVVVIGNHLDSRSEVDFSIFLQVQARVPITLIGKNQGVPGAITTKDRSEFLQVMRRFHILLFILQQPFEDGYNLAVLEAMQSGMAIVSLPNPSTLTQDGVNGFICDSVDAIVTKLNYLRAQPEITQKMGQRSREIVRDQFSLERFGADWRETIAAATRSV